NEAMIQSLNVSMISLRVQDGFKQEQAHRSKHQIVGHKQHDPETRAFAVQYRGGGLHHGEEGRDRDWEQQQGQHNLAAAGTQGHGGEESSVYNQRPGPEHRHQQQLPRRAQRPQPIKHDEQRSHERFQHGHENKIAQCLCHEQRVRGSGRDAVGVEHLVANLARPGLVERHHRREQERHPYQAAGDLARFFGARIERKTEHDHHQQRKKQHGVDGVLRSPLQAEVLEQRGAGDAGGGGHLNFSPVKFPPAKSPPARSPRLSGRFSSRVRPTILPDSIQTNSSAAPSSSDAWWVTMNSVLPGSRVRASRWTISVAEWVSTFEKGSSSKRILGSFSKARAKDMRCFMPCEYWPTGRTRSGSRPTARMTSTQRVLPVIP